MTLLHSIQRLIYYGTFVYITQYRFTSFFHPSSLCLTSEEPPVLQVRLLAMCKAHSSKLIKYARDL